MRDLMSELRPLGKPARSAYGRAMLMEDPELWLCHFVAGAWRAPLGTRMAPVMVQGRGTVGQVVLASRADLDRANAALRPAPQAEDLHYRRIVAALGDAPAGPAAPPARIRHGAIYLAAPQDAVFAIRLAQHVACAGLRPGAFAMVFQV